MCSYVFVYLCVVVNVVVVRMHDFKFSINVYISIYGCNKPYTYYMLNFIIWMMLPMVDTLKWMFNDENDIPLANYKWTRHCMTFGRAVNISFAWPIVPFLFTWFYFIFFTDIDFFLCFRYFIDLKLSLSDWQLWRLKWAVQIFFFCKVFHFI